MSDEAARPRQLRARPLVDGPVVGAAQGRPDTLRIFHTRVGDTPERILVSEVDLRDDWRRLRASEPVEVRRPLLEWEGAREPLVSSLRSAIDRPVNPLRDPDGYVEGEDAYLVYAVGGESGLAIARLELEEETG